MSQIIITIIMIKYMMAISSFSDFQNCMHTWRERERERERKEKRKDFHVYFRFFTQNRVFSAILSAHI